MLSSRIEVRLRESRSLGRHSRIIRDFRLTPSLTAHSDGHCCIASECDDPTTSIDPLSTDTSSLRHDYILKRNFLRTRSTVFDCSPVLLRFPFSFSSILALFSSFSFERLSNRLRTWLTRARHLSSVFPLWEIRFVCVLKPPRDSDLLGNACVSSADRNGWFEGLFHVAVRRFMRTT